MEKSRLPLFRKKTKGNNSNTSSKHAKNSDTSNQTGLSSGNSKKHEKGQGWQGVIIGNKGSKLGKSDKKSDTKSKPLENIDGGKFGVATPCDQPAKKWTYKPQVLNSTPEARDDGHNDGGFGKFGGLRRRHNSKGREDEKVQTGHTKSDVSSQSAYKHQGSFQSSGVSPISKITTYTQNEARQFAESSRDVDAGRVGRCPRTTGPEGLLQQSPVQPQVDCSSKDNEALCDGHTRYGHHDHGGEFSVCTKQDHMTSPGQMTSSPVVAIGNSGPPSHMVTSSYLDQFRKYYEYDITGRRMPENENVGSKSPSDPDSSPHHDYEDIDLIMSGVYSNKHHHHTQHHQLVLDQEIINNPQRSTQEKFSQARTPGMYDRGPLPPPPVPPHSSAYCYHQTPSDNMAPTSPRKTSYPSTTTSTSSSHSTNFSTSQPLARTHSNQSPRSTTRSHMPRLGLYKHSISAEGFAQRASSGQAEGGQISGSQSGSAWFNSNASSRWEDYEPLITQYSNSNRQNTLTNESAKISESVQSVDNFCYQKKSGVQTRPQGVEISRESDQIASDGVKTESSGRHTYEPVCNSHRLMAAVNQGFKGEGLRINATSDQVVALRSCCNNVQEESTPPGSPLDIVIPPPGIAPGYYSSPRKFTHFTYNTGKPTNQESADILSYSGNNESVDSSNKPPSQYHSNRCVTIQEMVARYNEKNGDRMYDQVPVTGEYHDSAHLPYEYSPVISQYKEKDDTIGTVSGERAPSYGYIYNTEIHPKYLSEKELQSHQFQQKYCRGIYSSKQDQSTEVSPPYTPILSSAATPAVSARQNSPRTVMQGFYALYSSPSGGERPLATQSPLFGRKHSFPSPSCGIRMAEMRAKAQRRWSDPKSPNYAAMAMDRSTPSPTGSLSSVHSYQSNILDDSMTTIREEESYHGNKKGDAKPQKSKRSSSSRYEKLNPEELPNSGIPEKRELQENWSQESQCSLSQRKRYPSEPNSTTKQSVARNSGSCSQYDSLQTMTCANSIHSLVERVGSNHNTGRDCTQGLLTSDRGVGHQSSIIPDEAANVTKQPPDDVSIPNSGDTNSQCSGGENGGSFEETINPSNGLITESFSEQVNKERASSFGGQVTSPCIKGERKNPVKTTTFNLQTEGHQSALWEKQTCDSNQIRSRVEEARDMTETVTPSSSGSISSLSEYVVTKMSSTKARESRDHGDTEQRKSQNDGTGLLPEKTELSADHVDVEDVNMLLKSTQKTTVNLSPQGSHEVCVPQGSITAEVRSSEVCHFNETKSKSDGLFDKTETTSNNKGNGKSNVISKLRPPSSVGVNRQGGGVKTEHSSGKSALKSHLKEMGNSSKPLPGTTKKGEINPTNLGQRQNLGGFPHNKEVNSSVKSTQITGKELKSSEGGSVKSTKTPTGASKLKAGCRSNASHSKGKTQKAEASGIPLHRKSTKGDICQASSGTDPNIVVGLPSKQENQGHHSGSNVEEEVALNTETCQSPVGSTTGQTFQMCKTPSKSMTESDDSLVMFTRRVLRNSAGKSHKRAASYSSISSCDPMSSLPSSPYSSQLSIDSISSDTFEYDLPSPKSSGVNDPSAKTVVSNAVGDNVCSLPSEEICDLRNNISNIKSNMSQNEGCHSNNTASSLEPTSKAIGSDHLVCTVSDNLLSKDKHDTQSNCDKSKASKSTRDCQKEAPKKPETNVSERRGSLSGIPTTKGFGFRGNSPKVSKKMSSSTSSESNVSSSSISGIAVRANSRERSRETKLTSRTNTSLASPSPSQNKGSQLKKPVIKTKLGPNIVSDAREQKQSARKDSDMLRKEEVFVKNKLRSSSTGRNPQTGPNRPSEESSSSKMTPLSFSRSNSSESNTSSKSSVKGDLTPTSVCELNNTGISPKKPTETSSKLRAPKSSKLMKPIVGRECHINKEQSGPMKIAKSSPTQAGNKTKVNTKPSTGMCKASNTYNKESKDNSLNKTVGEISDIQQHSRNSPTDINSSERKIKGDLAHNQNSCNTTETMEDTAAYARMGNTKTTTMTNTSEKATETQSLQREEEIVMSVTCEMTEAVITAGQRKESAREMAETSDPRLVAQGRSPSAEKMTAKASNHIIGSKPGLDESGNSCPSTSGEEGVTENACSCEADKCEDHMESSDDDVTGDGKTSLLSSQTRTQRVIDGGTNVPHCDHVTISATVSDIHTSDPQFTSKDSPMESNLSGGSDLANLFSGILLQEDGNCPRNEGGDSVTGVCDSDKTVMHLPKDSITQEMATKWLGNIQREPGLSRDEVASSSHNSSLIEENHTVVNRQHQDSSGGNETVSNNRAELGNETPLKAHLNRYGMAQKKGQLSVDEDRVTVTNTQAPLIGEAESLLKDAKSKTTGSLLKPQNLVHPYLVKPYASLRKNRSPDVTLHRGHSATKGSLSVHLENGCSKSITDSDQNKECDMKRHTDEVVSMREMPSPDGQQIQSIELKADCVKSTSKLSRVYSSPENTLTMSNPCRDEATINHSPVITPGHVSKSQQTPASQYAGSMTSGSSLCGSSAHPMSVRNCPSSSQLKEAVRSEGTLPETALFPLEAQLTLPRCQLAEHDPARNCQCLPQQIASINGTSSLGAFSINCDSNGDMGGPVAGIAEPVCIQREGQANQTLGHFNKSGNGRSYMRPDGDIITQTGDKENEATKDCRGKANETEAAEMNVYSSNRSLTSNKSHWNESQQDQVSRNGNDTGERDIEDIEYKGDKSETFNESKPNEMNVCCGKTRSTDEMKTQNKDNSKCESQENVNPFQTQNIMGKSYNETGNTNPSQSEAKTKNTLQQEPLTLAENTITDSVSSDSHPSLRPHHHPITTNAQQIATEPEQASLKENNSSEGLSNAANGVQARARFRGRRGGNLVAPEQASRSSKMADDRPETGGWIRHDSDVTKSISQKTGNHKPQMRLPDKLMCKKALSKLGKYKIHSASGNNASNSESFVNAKDPSSFTSSVTSVVGNYSSGVLEVVPSTSCLQNTEPLKRVVLSHTDNLSDESEGINEPTDISPKCETLPDNPTLKEVDVALQPDKLPRETFDNKHPRFCDNQKASFQQQQYDSYFVLNDQNSGRYMTFPAEPFSPKRKARKPGSISPNEPFEVKDQYIEDSYLGEPSFTSGTLFCPTVLDPTLSPNQRLSLGSTMQQQQQNGENMLNSLKLSESGYDSWKSQGSSSTACDPASDNEGQAKGEDCVTMEQPGQHLSQEDTGSISSSSCSDTDSINGMSTESVVTMKTVRECCSETNSGSNDEESKVSIATIEHRSFDKKYKQTKTDLKRVEVRKSKLSGSRSSSESTLATDAIKFLEWDTTYDNSLLAPNKDMSSIEDLLESAELFSRVRDTSDSMEYLLCEYDDFSDHNFDSGSMRKRLNFSGSDFALALHSMSKSPSEENVLDDCRNTTALLLQQGKNTLSSLSQGSCLPNSKLSGSGTMPDDNKIYSPTQAALSALNTGSKVTQPCYEIVNDTIENLDKSPGSQEKEARGDNNKIDVVLVQMDPKWSGSAQKHSQSAEKGELQNNSDQSPVSCECESAENSHSMAHISNHPAASSLRCEWGGDKSEDVLMGVSKVDGNLHIEGINYSQKAGVALQRDLGRPDNLTPGQLEKCRKDCNDRHSADNCSTELRSNRLTAACNEQIPKPAEVLTDREVNENRKCVDDLASNTQGEWISDSDHNVQRKTSPVHSNASPSQPILNKQTHPNNSSVKAKSALFESGVTFLNERRRQLFHSRHGDQCIPRKADLSSIPPPPPTNHDSNTRAKTGAQQQYLAVKYSHNVSPVNTQLSPTDNKDSPVNRGETSEKVICNNGNSGDNSGCRRFSAGLLDYRDRLLKHKEKTDKPRSKSQEDTPLVKQTVPASNKNKGQRKLGQVIEETRSGRESNCDTYFRHDKAQNPPRECNDSGDISDPDKENTENKQTDRPKSLNIPPRLSSGSSDLEIATKLFMEVTPPNEVFESDPNDPQSNNAQKQESQQRAAASESASYPIMHQSGISRQQSHEKYLKTRRTNQPSQNSSPRYHTNQTDRNISSRGSSNSQIPVFELQNGTLVSRNRPRVSSDDARSGDKESGCEQLAAEIDSQVDGESKSYQNRNQSDKSHSEQSKKTRDPVTMLPISESVTGRVQTDSENIPANQNTASRFSTSQIPWGQKRGSGAKVMEKLKLFQGQPKSPEDCKFSWSQFKFRKIFH